MIKKKVWPPALVAILMCSLTVPCFAKTAADSAGRGQPYPMCDDMLKKESAGQLEKSLVEQIANPAQALQLLFDYKLILSPTFAAAVRFTLTQRGLAFSGLDGKAPLTLGQLKDLSQSLKEMANWPEEKLRPVVTEVLLRMRQLSTWDRTFALKTSRLVYAIGEMPDGGFMEQALVTGLRQSLLMTARSAQLSRVSAMGLGIDPSVWRIGAGFFTFFGSLISVAVRGDCEYCTSPNFVQAFQENFQVIFSIAAGSGTLGAVLAHVASSGDRLTAAEKKRRKMKQLQKVVDSFEDKLLNFDVQDSSLRHLIFPPPDLLQPSQEVTDTGALTLKQACALNDICSLSLVDIAYLGYADRLALFALSEDLTTSVQTNIEQYELQNILTSLQKIKAAPSEFALHFDFVQQIRASVAALKAFKSEFQKKVDTLCKTLNAVQSSVRKLRDLPFKNNSPAASVKNRALYEKVQLDLNDLATIELSTGEMKDRMNALSDLIAQLNRLEAAIRAEPLDWPDFAAKVQFALQLHHAHYND